MAIAVLDSSVLIAFLDPGDAHHDAAVRAMVGARRSDVVVPATVYSETLVHPYRSGQTEANRIERFFDEMAFRIEPVGAELARAAARLRARHGQLRLPDAIVIAAGELLAAGRVLTCDARWKPVSRRVRVVA